MSVTPSCAGKHELFDSDQPEDIREATTICRTCPLIEACRQQRDQLIADGLMPVGTWAGGYGPSAAFGSGVVVGKVEDRSAKRIAAEEAMYDDRQGYGAWKAYRAGDRSEWARVGYRVIERRRKRRQREGNAA